MTKQPTDLTLYRLECLLMDARDLLMPDHLALRPIAQCLDLVRRLRKAGARRRNVCEGIYDRD